MKKESLLYFSTPLIENGRYVMGEAIQNTFIPFENFARVSTWIFFSTIIGWYCVSRIGWKRTAGNKIVGWRMALLQLMLLGFSIITEAFSEAKIAVGKTLNNNTIVINK